MFLLEGIPRPPHTTPARGVVTHPKGKHENMVDFPWCRCNGCAAIPNQPCRNPVHTDETTVLTGTRPGAGRIRGAGWS